MLQPCEANSLLPLHTTWDVSSDCSKVTPSTQILPSLVGAHNSTLPSPSPSHPVSPFFSSIQLPVWRSDWFILICSTHIPRLDIAKQPPLSPLSPFPLPHCFCALSFGLLLIHGCDHCISDCRNVFIVLIVSVLQERGRIVS